MLLKLKLTTFVTKSIWTLKKSIVKQTDLSRISMVETIKTPKSPKISIGVEVEV